MDICSWPLGIHFWHSEFATVHQIQDGGQNGCQKWSNLRKSHISAKKYDISMNKTIRYMFLIIAYSIQVFLFCYHTSNSRWRPKWPPKVVRFEEKVIYQPKNMTKAWIKLLGICFWSLHIQFRCSYFATIHQIQDGGQNGRQKWLNFRKAIYQPKIW